MSAAFVHVWQYGIQCDHPGSFSANRASRASAQRDAKAAGWSVASDRLVSNRDLCKEHAWPVSGGVGW